MALCPSTGSVFLSESASASCFGTKLSNTGCGLVISYWIFTGIPVRIRTRSLLLINFCETKDREGSWLLLRTWRMFRYSFLSCSSSFRMHSGDLLVLVTLLPIRFRCPLTWLERPVLVSNQPQHRGHVCSPWVSGLTAVISDKVMSHKN